MIKLKKKDQIALEHLSKEDFEGEMGIKWRSGLLFQKDAYLQKALKQSKKAMRKKELNIRERWLGVFFQKEISEEITPDLSIRYVDPILGYGVFAEEKIEKGAYIGQYSGVIRKRKRGFDRKNDYCFEYTIGDWVYNPFIIDAKEEGNITRFINHSDEPNLESLSVFSEGLMHIIFIAGETILPGSQLCYHYGDTFWKKRRHAKKLVNFD